MITAVIPGHEMKSLFKLLFYSTLILIYSNPLVFGNPGFMELCTSPDSQQKHTLSVLAQKVDSEYNAEACALLLEKLGNLREVNLENSRIKDLSPIAYLTQLKKLMLDYNKVEDLSPLESLNRLEKLFLVHNRISDIQPLSQLKGLVYLYLNDNDIADISPLRGLKELKYLYIAHNSISDLSPLSYSSRLTWLIAENNQIRSVSPIRRLKYLKRLDLRENPVSDICPIAHFANYNRFRLPEHSLSSCSKPEPEPSKKKKTPGKKPPPKKEEIRKSSSSIVIDPDTLPEVPLYTRSLLDTMESRDKSPSDPVNREVTTEKKPQQEVTEKEANRMYPESAPQDEPEETDILPSDRLAMNRRIWSSAEFKPEPEEYLRQLNNLAKNRAQAKEDGKSSIPPGELSEPAAKREPFIVAGRIVPELPSTEEPAVLEEALKPTEPSAPEELPKLEKPELPYKGDTIFPPFCLSPSRTQKHTLDVLAQKVGLPYSVETCEEIYTRAKRLIMLILHGKGIEDVSPFENLDNLNMLFLYSNQIENIEPLKHLQNLRSLGLDHNRITDISPLAHLSELRTLSLHNNKIRSIESLAYLKELRSLSLHNNHITEIKPLRYLTKLKTLKLNNNNVKNLDPLRYLSALTELHLKKNMIDSVAPLEGLEKLEKLDLRMNGLEDFQPIQKLANYDQFLLEDDSYAR